MYKILFCIFNTHLEIIQIVLRTCWIDIIANIHNCLLYSSAKIARKEDEEELRKIEEEERRERLRKEARKRKMR